MNFFLILNLQSQFPQNNHNFIISIKRIIIIGSDQLQSQPRHRIIKMKKYFLAFLKIGKLPLDMKIHLETQVKALIPILKKKNNFGISVNIFF
jgi:hypothetical protein